MIRSFRHKGLERFFLTGSKKGIIPSQAEKIERILDRLDASISPVDMNLPGYGLHQLKGKETGIWSVIVNANWRITFQFISHDVFGVDYRDYH